MWHLVEWGDTLIADDELTLSLMSQDHPDAVRPAGCGRCRACVSGGLSSGTVGMYGVKQDSSGDWYAVRASESGDSDFYWVVPDGSGGWAVASAEDEGLALKRSSDDYSVSSRTLDDPVTVEQSPWFHVDNPATGDFYGLIVSAMEGALSRTTDARLSEGLADGGWITGLREGPREVRVKMTLYASSEAGLNAGQAWLSGVVTDVDRDFCGIGQVMTFGVACPNEAAWSSTQHTTRQLVSCVVRSGPEVIRTSSARGLWAREVEMGVVSQRGTIMRPAMEHVDAHAGTIGDGVTVETVSSVPDPCPPPTSVQVMRDPANEIPVPPVVQGPGSNPDPLTETFTHKQRVAVSGAAEPWVRRSVRVGLYADAGDVSSARVRFFPMSDYTPCGELAEFYVRYVQDGWNLVIDGVENNIFAWSGSRDNFAQASHLIRSMYQNKAFSYPMIPTGEGFYMVVESNGSLQVSVESAVVE